MIMADSPLTKSDEAIRGSQTSAETLTLDEVFDVLANQRRRHVLHSLRDRQLPVTLIDLAKDVATREQETLNGDVPPEEVSRVHLALYHSHIPKLADANIVDYSRERDAVTLSVETDRVESLLDLAASAE